MHFLTTVFNVSHSRAGARIIGKYPSVVCSVSSVEIDRLNTVQNGFELAS
jgi:hypothetical protein